MTDGAAEAAALVLAAQNPLNELSALHFLLEVAAHERHGTERPVDAAHPQVFRHQRFEGVRRAQADDVLDVQVLQELRHPGLLREGRHARGWASAPIRRSGSPQPRAAAASAVGPRAASQPPAKQ